MLNAYPLTVEFVGKVPGFDWLTQVLVKLPDNLPAGQEGAHLSPQLVLSIRPGKGNGHRRDATRSDIEMINQRAVACSDCCISGTTALSNRASRWSAS